MLAQAQWELMRFLCHGLAIQVQERSTHLAYINGPFDNMGVIVRKIKDKKAFQRDDLGSYQLSGPSHLP